jgi:tRNA(Arg) A34 adenosine deaminase TadA
MNRYDVYLTKEPNVYESMALVHSRVRRVVFGVQDREMGGLGGIAEDATTTTNGQHNNGIHSLPGTNHHYRAFRFDMMVNSGGEGDEEIAALKATLMQLHREDVSP